MTDNNDNNISDDQLLSQFLAFTGSADPSVARQYLEMSGNQLEMAVSLFMDHNNNNNAGGAGGGTAGGGGIMNNNPMGSPQVRAPDATRSMRLVGGPPSPGRGGGGGGGNNNNNNDAAALMAAVGGPNAAQQMMMMGMMGGHGGGGAAAAHGGGGNNDNMEDIMASTWASRDLRETVNRAAAAAAASSSSRRNRRNRSGSGSGGARNHSNNSNSNNNNDHHSNSSRRRRTGSRSHSSSSAAENNNNNNNNNINNNNNDSDDEVQVVDEDGNVVGEVMEESDEDSYNYNDQSDDDDSMGGAEPAVSIPANRTTQLSSLSTMFQPPNHLIHRGGGFLGAKNFAKDARRWLLVNIQTDDDFACHALNRDVWHDELVENLVREGFVFWQTLSTSPEGMTYCQRYKVEGYPHIAIIDPRTGSLLYRKEGWTQVNPLTAEQFVEIASDFCSRHSFDKLPMPARHGYANGGAAGGGFGMGGSGESRPAKRPVHELSEQEQLEAAIRASMQDASGEQQSDDDDDDDKVQVLDQNDNDDIIGKSKEDETTTKSDGGDDNDNNNDDDEDESKLSPFEKEILSMTVLDEPTTTGPNIARVQFRMPDGKRLIRKFDGNAPVKIIYAFVAQLEANNEEAKSGKSFELKAKFPPVDLLQFAEQSISSCGLSGEAITFLWK